MESERLFDKTNLLYQKAMKGRVIEPTDIRKYRGSINLSRKGVYNVNIQSKKFPKPLTKSFKTYAEAFDFVKATSKKHNLPVRNRITDHGIYMKVETTKGRKMIFDRRNIEFVQRHNIYTSGGGKHLFYAHTQLPSDDPEKPGSVDVTIHNLLMGHKPDIKGLTVDHANRNTEDNRMHNMRLVNRTIQSTNQNMRSDNKTGHVGVYYSSGRYQDYTAGYKDNGVFYRKSFSIAKYGHDRAKQMAIDYRKYMISTIPAYVEAFRTDTQTTMDDEDVYQVSDDLEYDYRSL